LKTTPKITLVGAGPGDPDLLTIKGHHAIKNASVILYDALVNQKLLNLAPKALKIYVGKRKDHKSFEQNDINQLNVKYALQYGNLVRLKGGDPFVFGRGMEEMIYAESFGIKTEVIPGISSCIAVPEVVGIPLTHRGTSNSFFVLSATQADGTLNPEIHIAAKSNATVVILMGLHKLEVISGIFRANGKGSTHSAVIINGSLSTQQTISTSISELPQAYKEINLQGPGIIVIGEVVKFIMQKKNAIIDTWKSIN